MTRGESGGTGRRKHMLSKFFEDEKDKYYAGVEKQVMEAIAVEDFRHCQAWDDWAMYDELHKSAPTRSRKRLFLEVAVGPQLGGQGPEQKLRAPVDVGSGVLMTVNKLLGRSHDGSHFSSPTWSCTSTRRSDGRHGAA